MGGVSLIVEIANFIAFQKDIVIMKRFKTILKPVIGILTVVPFSLIGLLVVGKTASKPGPEESQSGAEQHYKVNSPLPSSNVIIDGGTVVIRNSPMSRLSQPGCVKGDEPCETLSGRWVGVWGETVFRRNPK